MVEEKIQGFGTAEVWAQVLDVEPWEDAPRRGYVGEVCIGHHEREDPEGPHPTPRKQQAGGEGHELRVQQHLVSDCEPHVPPKVLELRLELVLQLLQQRQHLPRHEPIRVAASSPGPTGSQASGEASGRRGCWPRSA